MKIEPYLSFEGRCEEAIDFYRQALGAEVEMLMRMKDNPEPPPGGTPAAIADKVLHASLKIGGNRVMMSDGMMQGPGEFKGFALSISVADEAAAKKVFAAVAEGGQAHMPLGRTFWSPCFGMAADKFGVMWMVSVDLAARG
jgi:PhnB protein